METALNLSIAQAILNNFQAISLQCVLWVIRYLNTLNCRFFNRLHARLVGLVQRLDYLSFNDRGYLTEKAYLEDVGWGMLEFFYPDDSFADLNKDRCLQRPHSVDIDSMISVSGTVTVRAKMEGADWQGNVATFECARGSFDIISDNVQRFPFSGSYCGDFIVERPEPNSFTYDGIPRLELCAINPDRLIAQKDSEYFTIRALVDFWNVCAFDPEPDFDH